MNSITATNAVSAMDRFAFTLFFATAIHAVVIMGVGFSYSSRTPPVKTLEVTLAQNPQDQKPKDADFIAQANQAGSGENAEKALPSTNQQALFQTDDAQQQASHQSPFQQAVNSQSTVLTDNHQGDADANHQSSQNPVDKPVISTTNASQYTLINTPEQQQASATVSPSGLSDTDATSVLDIANLQAELEQHREVMARKPRIKRLTSASTEQRDDALYLENWRKKIEQVGNLNYPEEAKQNKLYGSLRLLVVINPDGSVKNIELLESSGRRILDDAAIRIVQLAAPFQPFSTEMRKTTDLLEIIRTWKFEKKASVY